MVNPDLAKITTVLRDAAHPCRIILFGSHARGEAGADSDLDFLVVEPTVTNRVDEMVRLRRLLSAMRIPVDVLVVSEQVFREQAGIPGNYLHAAATEGRVLFESA